MRVAPVCLEPVNAANWRECIALRVKDSQLAFVSSNVFSLAQSKFEVSRIPMAVYTPEHVMVGFVMYNNLPLPEGGYRISRLMIDRNHQGRGYGVSTAIEVIKTMRRIAGCTEIRLDYHPLNDQAAILWRSLDFTACGKIGDNIEMCLQL